MVESKLSECPDCDHSLSSSQGITQHTQEDIDPAHVEVTVFKRHRYWCKHCKKIVSAPYGEGKIPQGKIGPNTLIHMALLKYHHGPPANKIVELMQELAGLKISEGAISQALQRFSKWLEVETEVILEAIRASPDIRTDETGWKVNGKGHWQSHGHWTKMGSMRRNVIRMRPIGRVRGSAIEVSKHWASGLEGIEKFSHLIIVYWLDKARKPEMWIQPKGLKDFPKIGFLATRTQHRPNPIGVTVVKLLKRRGARLWVEGLDAWNGTQILDIKPYTAKDFVKGFKIPGWMHRLDRLESDPLRKYGE